MMLAPVAMANVGIDAKSAGAANTGIASGDFTRATLNPALLTRFKDADDVYVRLGARALVNEYKDALDQVDDTQDAIDSFEDKINAMDPNNLPTQEDADAVIAELKALDSTYLEGSAGVDFGVFVPSKRFGFGFAASTYVVANGDFDFAESDEALINEALKTGRFDENDLTSSGVANAVGVTEFSVLMATELKLESVGEFSIGTSLKYQRLDSYLYRATIANYDDGDYFDDEYMTDDSAFNVDIGLHKQVGDWSYGVVARDLISQSITNIEGQSFDLEPTMSAAVAWHYTDLTTSVEVDLVKNESFVAQEGAPVLLLPRQFAKLGLEYQATHAQIRLGYQHDFKNNYSSLVTLGLGVSPWDAFSLDLVGQLGEDDEIGAALQLGIKI